MINTLTKNGKTIKYQIVIKKIKHTYFHFKDDGLLITTNKHVSNNKIIKVLNDNFDKIYRKINSKIKLESDEILFFGKTLKVVVEKGSKFNYSISDSYIYIDIPKNGDLEKKINEIYKIELTKKIDELELGVSERIEKIGLKLVPFKIKNVKSYYGKCYPNRKEIVFSLNLAKIDSSFLEYVIYHEYAHLIEANHSKKFYRILETLMPNYKSFQKKLKKIRL